VRPEWLVGAILAIVLGGLSDRHDDAYANVNLWSWEEGSTHPHFALTISEGNWSTITLNVMGGLHDRIADDRVRRAIDRFVNSAMSFERNGCARHYLFDKIGEWPDGSLLIFGHCPTDTEWQAAGGDAFARAGA